MIPASLDDPDEKQVIRESWPHDVRWPRGPMASIFAPDLLDEPRSAEHRAPVLAPCGEWNTMP
jgi:hypothetical protein